MRCCRPGKISADHFGRPDPWLLGASIVLSSSQFPQHSPQYLLYWDGTPGVEGAGPDLSPERYAKKEATSVGGQVILGWPLSI